MTSLRVGVVGAGAIGGYFGGMLASVGHDVVLIDGWPAHVAAIQREGLRIEGMDPSQTVVVAVRALDVTDVQALSREAGLDVAIIATKSYDTDWAAALIHDYLRPDGFAVSLQNAINEYQVAAQIGWERTTGGVVMIAGELIAPGLVRRTMGPQTVPHVEFRFGEPDGRASSRLERLAEAVRAFDGADVTNNLWGESWSKLCINVIRNGISAATGLAGNERDSIPGLRRFAIRLGGEAVAVATALGHRFDHIGSLPTSAMAQAGAGDPAAIAQVEAWMIAGTLGGARSNAQRPSMAQDMAKRRRSEIGAINGFVASEAARLGLPAPANKALVSLVLQVERGDVTPAAATVLQLEYQFAAIRRAA